LEKKTGKMIKKKEGTVLFQVNNGEGQKKQGTEGKKPVIQTSPPREWGQHYLEKGYLDFGHWGGYQQNQQKTTVIK